MIKERPLVLIGDNAFAEIAYEYFTYDSPFDVVGFAVERSYMKKDELFGLPVVAFEDLEQRFAPEAHSFFAALVYTQGNALRERLYRAAKAKGYTPASYVSSRAFVWRNVTLGEHCFIFEDNTVQPFVTLGDNVILWSGNHIGHHSRVGSHTFVSSHCVISGFVSVGTHAFLGVNCTLANNLTVGDRVLIAAGGLVIGNVPDDTRVIGLWRRPKEA